MNKKSVLCFTLLSLFLLGFVFVEKASAQVGSQTALNKFQITVKKIELSYDNGSTYTTIFSGTSTSVDLSLGVSAGSFVSNVQAPVGKVTNMRVTVNGTGIVVKGTISNAGTTYYTVANTNTDDTRTGPAVDQTINSTDQTITQALDLEIKEGKSQSVKVTFNIQNANNIIRGQAVASPWGFIVIIANAPTANITVI